MLSKFAYQVGYQTLVMGFGQRSPFSGAADSSAKSFDPWAVANTIFGICQERVPPRLVYWCFRSEEQANRLHQLNAYLSCLERVVLSSFFGRI
jgi:hypothetical protein